MKKILFAAMGLIAFAVIFFLTVVHEIPTRGPAEIEVFYFDVPLRDDNIIAIAAAANYHQINEEVIFSDEEIYDRVRSNLLVAFGLATAGMTLEDVQGMFDEDRLQGEVEKSIAFFNNSKYEVVKVDNFKFLLIFDPPIEYLKEGPPEEIGPQHPLNLGTKGVRFTL